MTTKASALLLTVFLCLAGAQIVSAAMERHVYIMPYKKTVVETRDIDGTLVGIQVIYRPVCYGIIDYAAMTPNVRNPLVGIVVGYGQSSQHAACSALDNVVQLSKDISGDVRGHQDFIQRLSEIDVSSWTALKRSRISKALNRVLGSNAENDIRGNLKQTVERIGQRVNRRFNLHNVRVSPERPVVVTARETRQIIERWIDRILVIPLAWAANKVTDTFTSSSWTELSSHTPDTGSVWIKTVGTSTKKIEINPTPDEAQSNTTVEVAYQTNSADDTATVNQDVSCDIKPGTDTTQNCDILGRGSRTAQDYYIARIVTDGTYHDIELLKDVSGTETSLGTYTVGTVGQATYATYKLEIRTATKKIYQNGTERISSGDDNFSGKAGGIRTKDSQTCRWDNFALDEAAAAAARRVITVE